MTSSIQPRAPLPHLSNGNEKKPLKRSNSIWYAGTDSALTQKDKNRPIPTKLSAEKVHIISEKLQAIHTGSRTGHPKTNTSPKAFQADLSATLTKSSVKKTPPVLPVRSDKTCLSSAEPSNIRSSVKKTPPVLPVRSDKTCLSSAKHSHIEAPKNTCPLPPPQESKPKLHPVSAATATSLQKRVSFPTKAAKDRGPSHLPQILNTLPVKGILKRTLSFNTEGNELYNEANSSKKIHIPSVITEKPDAEKELDSAMAELNAVLENLGIDPVLNSP